MNRNSSDAEVRALIEKRMPDAVARMETLANDSDPAVAASARRALARRNKRSGANTRKPKG